LGKSWRSNHTSKKSNTNPPQEIQSYFLPSGKTIEVDPEKIPTPQRLPQHLDISEASKPASTTLAERLRLLDVHVIVRKARICNEATDRARRARRSPGITPSRASAARPSRRTTTLSSKFPTGTKTTQGTDH